MADADEPTSDQWQLPFSIDEIRKHNPHLDDEQAHRAYLPPCTTEPAGRGYSDAQWDALVDSLCSSAPGSPVDVPRLVRRSRIKLNRLAVQLYTTDFSDAMVAGAARAGFFVFGSEFAFPGAPIEERSLLNLELCAQPTASAGRIVMEGVDGLKIGKKTMKHIRSGVDVSGRTVIVPTTDIGGVDGLDVASAVVSTDRSLGSCGAVSDGEGAAATANKCDGDCIHGDSTAVDSPLSATTTTAAAASAAARSSASGITAPQYRLSVNCRFDEVITRIVEQHGVDWVGFTGIQRALSRLSRDSSSAVHGVRVVSIELWAEDQLVSGEIGHIVGSCYTCLSLFADEINHPRCSRVRLYAAHLFLARAGVTLFDAGTTATYFVTLHGYTRKTRLQFVRLWREHRNRPLAHPSVLSEGCTDVNRFLLDHVKREDTISGVDGLSAPLRARGIVKGGGVVVHGDVDGTGRAASANSGASPKLCSEAKDYIANTCAATDSSVSLSGRVSDVRKRARVESSHESAGDTDDDHSSTLNVTMGNSNKGAGIRVTWDGVADVHPANLERYFGRSGRVLRVIMIGLRSAIVVFESVEAVQSATLMVPTEVVPGAGILRIAPVAQAKQKKRRREQAPSDKSC